MKKARKLGLQSLALVLMAFVLVAGVAFGMTGAWFQSAQQTSNDIQMGHEVNIKLFEGETQLTGTPAVIELTHARESSNTVNDTDMTRAMPGDTYTLTGDITLQSTVNNAMMYVFVKISTTNDIDGEGITLNSYINQNALAGQDGVTNLNDANLEGYTVYTFAKSDEPRSYTLWDDADVITIDEDLTNEVKDAHLTIAIDVRACQVANRTLEEAAQVVGLNLTYTQEP